MIYLSIYLSKLCSISTYLSIYLSKLSSISTYLSIYQNWVPSQPIYQNWVPSQPIYLSKLSSISIYLSIYHCCPNSSKMKITLTSLTLYQIYLPKWYGNILKYKRLNLFKEISTVLTKAFSRLWNLLYVFPTVWIGKCCHYSCRYHLWYCTVLLDSHETANTPY